MNSTTAILFFSRTASAEARVKSLHQEAQCNKAALESLIERTRSVVRRSDLPVFWITEKQQQGNSFGERLFNAAQEIVACGYEKLIIIGNDSPQLKLSDIKAATKALDNGQAVLGKNNRGGAYLIGLDANHLTSQFKALPWQTEQLFANLCDFLSAQYCTSSLLLRQPLGVLLLREVYDFNTSKDWKALKVISHGFRFLDGVFNSIAELLVTDYQLLKKLQLIIDFSLRGPPVLG